MSLHDRLTRLESRAAAGYRGYWRCPACPSGITCDSAAGVEHARWRDGRTETGPLGRWSDGPACETCAAAEAAGYELSVCIVICDQDARGD